jgi:hypothetical protein
VVRRVVTTYNLYGDSISYTFQQQVQERELAAGGMSVKTQHELASTSRRGAVRPREVLGDLLLVHTVVGGDTK